MVFGSSRTLLRRALHTITKSRLIITLRWCSTSRSINALLSGDDDATIGDNVKSTGWVRSVRAHKDIIFLDVSDGSCLKSLQVVATPGMMHEDLTFGCSVEVEGKLTASKSSSQLVELKADSITVIGPCSAEYYPFKARSRYHGDYLRQLPHLRSRTDAFAALLRIRNAVTMATHRFFQENGFIHVHTPIITSNDCEGAGDLFTVESEKTNEADEQNPFFDVPAYLTVSGQLHLEALACSHSKVYTLGPTFRAENSRTRKHLSEFYMIEAEMINTDTIENITQLIEDLIKEVTGSLLETCKDDTNLFYEHVSPNHKEIIDKMLQSKFHIITYSEAISLLEKHSDTFSQKPFWGCDFNTEQEIFVVQYFNNLPVFVVNFPRDIKPFYARDNQDNPHTVSTVDLLVPGIGELVGGSLREERAAILKERLEINGLVEDYQWYLDLRNFGSVPHGGFGMGFERYLQLLLGVKNIKDVVPFPRYTHSCKL